MLTLWFSCVKEYIHNSQSILFFFPIFEVIPLTFVNTVSSESFTYTATIVRVGLAVQKSIL